MFAMSAQKRKPLDDSLAQAFVYGADQNSVPSKKVASKPENQSKTISSESNLLAKLKTTVKEPTIRFTADLPESIHRKLSILAARTGKKKVEIVRMLLVEALQEIED